MPLLFTCNIIRVFLHHVPYIISNTILTSAEMLINCYLISVGSGTDHVVPSDIPGTVLYFEIGLRYVNCLAKVNACINIHLLNHNPCHALPFPS